MRCGKRQRGSVLLMAVMVVAAMSIGGAALWRYLHVTLEQERRLENNDTCLHLAEAGLDRAVAMLRVQPGSYTGEERVPLGEGQYSVEVIREAAAGQYRLVSKGVLADGGAVRAQKTLEAPLKLSAAGEVLEYYWQEQKR